MGPKLEDDALVRERSRLSVREVLAHLGQELLCPLYSRRDGRLGTLTNRMRRVVDALAGVTHMRSRQSYP
jgi:hypothetical protein